MNAPRLRGYAFDLGGFARSLVRHCIEAQDCPRERAYYEWFDLAVRYGFIRQEGER